MLNQGSRDDKMSVECDSYLANSDKSVEVAKDTTCRFVCKSDDDKDYRARLLL